MVYTHRRLYGIINEPVNAGHHMTSAMSLTASHWSPVRLMYSKTWAEVRLQNILHPQFSLYIFFWYMLNMC